MGLSHFSVLISSVGVTGYLNHWLWIKLFLASVLFQCSRKRKKEIQGNNIAGDLDYVELNIQ